MDIKEHSSEIAEAEKEQNQDVSTETENVSSSENKETAQESTSEKTDVFIIDDSTIDIFDKPRSKISKPMSKVSIPWVDKYRPNSIDDMVLDEETKKMFKEMLKTHDIKDMSLFGEPGKGKTSLARLLARLVDAETLFIACGTDGTVDVVRNRIQPFCESASSGRIKCIILDEFDASSGGNAAANGMQKALRSLMEAYTDTRFIITCNYPQKIIKPIFSRCQKVHIGFGVKDVALRLKQIWENEGIEYDRETATEFVKKYVYPRMPDIRSIINLAEMFCCSGKLVLSGGSQTNVGSNELSEFADRIIKFISNGTSYKDVRHMVLANSHIFSGDYELMIGALADAVVRKDLDPSIIPILSDYAYKMSQVTDPSLQMIGAIITLYGKLQSTK